MLRKTHLLGHTAPHKKNYLRVTPKPLAQRAVERVGMRIIEGHAGASSEDSQWSRWWSAETITDGR